MELEKERSAHANYRDVLLRLIPCGVTQKTTVVATCGEFQDQDVDWYLDPPKDHQLVDVRPFNWWQFQVDHVKSPRIRFRIRELLENAEGHFTTLTKLALTKEEGAMLHKAVRTFALLKRAKFEEIKFRSGVASSMSFLDKTPWDDPHTCPTQWANMVDVWEREDKVFSKVIPKGKRSEAPKVDYVQKTTNPQKGTPSRRPPPRSKKSQQQNKRRPNNGKCWNCDQTGHVQRNCPKLKGQASRATDPKAS